jgi:hypothetical protein
MIIGVEIEVVKAGGVVAMMADHSEAAAVVVDGTVDVDK